MPLPLLRLLPPLLLVVRVVVVVVVVVVIPPRRLHPLGVLPFRRDIMITPSSSSPPIMTSVSNYCKRHAGHSFAWRGCSSS